MSVDFDDYPEAAPNDPDISAPLALVKAIRATPFRYSKGAVAWADEEFVRMMDERAPDPI